jgi:Cyclin, N-terminal domain/Cyclin, C-terminal domain
LLGGAYINRNNKQLNKRTIWLLDWTTPFTATMLKLTMCPRKRSKRMRAYFARLRQIDSEQQQSCFPQNVSPRQQQQHLRDPTLAMASGATATTAAAANTILLEQRDMMADNLAKLLLQERSGAYVCTDYLLMTTWKRNIYDLLPKGRLNVQHQGGDTRIDEYCREQIVEWSFRVVDYFRIDREVVAVSLSMLDRFLAICHCDRSTFKLAATTTLHLAVKILHPCKLGELGVLSDLSRGEFDMQDVAAMERHVLESLEWKLHPPTPIAISTILLDHIFSQHSLRLNTTDMDDLYDISSFFTELALCDYHFVGVTPSVIALASMVNALEGMFGPDNKVAPQILSAAGQLGIYTHQDLATASHRLWELYERSEECALHNNYDHMEEEKTPDSRAPATAGGATTKDIFVNKGDVQQYNSGSPVSVSQKPCNSMTQTELMCSMRSQSVRNGSW